VPNTGLPDALYGTDLDSSADQYNAIFGATPELDPETADTWTVGVVLTPTFIDNFSMTIDYWNIKVEDTIGTVPPANRAGPVSAHGRADTAASSRATARARCGCCPRATSSPPMSTSAKPRLGWTSA